MEAGLYYYNARYYNPALGRFTTADTVLDGLNRYAYCGNNPVKFKDPTGNWAVGFGDIVSAVNDAVNEAVGNLNESYYGDSKVEPLYVYDVGINGAGTTVRWNPELHGPLQTNDELDVKRSTYGHDRVVARLAGYKIGDEKLTLTEVEQRIVSNLKKSKESNDKQDATTVVVQAGASGSGNSNDGASRSNGQNNGRITYAPSGSLDDGSTRRQPFVVEPGDHWYCNWFTNNRAITRGYLPLWITMVNKTPADSYPYFVNECGVSHSKVPFNNTVGYMYYWYYTPGLRQPQHVTYYECRKNVLTIWSTDGRTPEVQIEIQVDDNIHNKIRKALPGLKNEEYDFIPLSPIK